MISIYEHSVEESLIQKGGFAIDFGCGTDFLFSKGIEKYGLKVISVDPNPKIVNIPENANIFYENCALVTKEDIQNVTMKLYNDADAATISMANSDILHSTSSTIVKTTTIENIMKKYSVDQFEILKLDIEGSEYEFLMSIDRPIAKQITVEFHDFRNINPYFPNNEKYYELLFEKLGKWYRVAKHKLEEHKGMPQNLKYNYWDSLFILK